MKFVSLLKKFILLTLTVIYSIVEISNKEIEKINQKEKNSAIPIDAKKTISEKNILKNVDQISFSTKKKFSISKEYFKVKNNHN